MLVRQVGIELCVALLPLVWGSIVGLCIWLGFQRLDIEFELAIAIANISVFMDGLNGNLYMGELTVVVIPHVKDENGYKAKSLEGIPVFC